MAEAAEEKKPTLELITQEEAVSMPALIADGQERLAKAQAYVKNMPTIADDEADKTAKELVDTMSMRMKTFNETRSPFTRKLTEITKKFTTVENGWQELITTVSKRRDTYAAGKLAKARTAQAAVNADLAVKQAKIDLEGRIKEVLRMKITVLVDKVRATAGLIVSKVTKETLEQSKKDLSREPRWVPEKMDAEYYAIPDWIADKEHFMEVAKAEFPTNEADYIARAKQALQDSLGIIDVAITDKAQAATLMDLAKQEDDKKVVEDVDEIQRDIEGQKIIAKLDVEQVEMPKVKTKWKIQILNDDAWVQIFSEWWRLEKEKESDKLEKKTLGSMKTFMEKHATTNQEFIDHPSLTYIEDVKAK